MISIILCTYNGAKYVNEQLQSLLQQSLQPDEVLIKDDGSTDNTIEICEKFISEHKLNQWRVISNKENQGWANNFMQGFDEVSGDIIFPCDQDDIWEPYKIRKMMEILENHPEIDLLVGNYRKMIQDGDKITVDQSRKYSGEVKKIPFNEKMLYIDYPGCVYAFRKTLINEIKPYSFDRYPHDALLIRMARLLGTAYLYDEPVILFRRHGNNASGRPLRNNNETIERIQYYIHCLEKMKDYCTEHQGKEIEKALIEKNIQFYKIRLKAFEKHRILGKDSLFSCIRYIKYYQGPRGFLGDIYRIIH